MSEPRIHDAVILGAGYGGLGIGAEFKRCAIESFVILERAPEIGGVWRDNVYPGAACDTQSVIYCYDFFLNTTVSRMYAGQVELLGYLHRLADAFGLREHIRLDTEVLSAHWDQDRALWIIRTTRGDYLARCFVPAWGQLGAAVVPEIPGRDRFAGPSFHSARWAADVELADKRVASVGAAASAVQYVPEVARVASRLVVFQRSANYILPRDQHVFTAEESAAFERDPAVFAAVRREIHELREAGFARTRHDTDAQAAGVAEARAHLEAQVTDPRLRAQLTPDYEFGCKRILRSDDYYPALVRGNVRLETDPIDHFTETGIVTRSGTHHELDVVIFGTGFRSQAFNDSVTVTGRDGADLHERWGDAAEAYLGMTVDGFPNMFLVYGPNTNLNHNSIVTMLEIQDGYIAQAVRSVIDHPGRVLEVSPDRLREFNRWLQRELGGSSYSSDCSSWYKNEAGQVINNWSGTVESYRELAGTLRLDDFNVSEMAAVER